MLCLLNKLLEDGNTLYKRNKLQGNIIKIIVKLGGGDENFIIFLYKFLLRFTIIMI